MHEITVGFCIAQAGAGAHLYARHSRQGGRMLVSQLLSREAAFVPRHYWSSAKAVSTFRRRRMSTDHDSNAHGRSDQHDGPSTSGSSFDCDIESHLSHEARTRTLSTLSKFIFGFSGIPDMVSFHGGLPPPSIFPFKSIKLETNDGQWLDIPAGDKVHPLQAWHVHAHQHLTYTHRIPQHSPVTCKAVDRGLLPSASKSHGLELS